MHKKKIKQSSCFVERIQIEEDSFTLPCNGEALVLFEDVTPNHNKGMLTISNFSFPNECTISVEIETDNQAPIIRNIPITNGRRYDLENVRKITINCLGIDPQDTCRGQIKYIHDFCICCGARGQEPCPRK
ncbi:hypothetical protein [Rossellomorea aquimaris]|uniref:hypothetical protein n=1 Tax=Rossellomorea aquimaris TaxID=189382 RepID=UPI0005CB6579|nr:hypothetical protein [Rossellomorea aquimaris]